MCIGDPAPKPLDTVNVHFHLNDDSSESESMERKNFVFLNVILINLPWEKNFRIMDIEINAWSPQFIILQEASLIFSFYYEKCVNQPIEWRMPNPEKPILKFYAPTNKRTLIGWNLGGI